MKVNTVPSGNGSAYSATSPLLRALSAFTFTAIIAIGLGLLPGVAQAQGPDRAHVIVQFDDTSLTVRPIDFTAPISGLLALQLTGLDMTTQSFGWGTAVCAIEGVGCPADNCFCDPTNFWSYNYWDGSAWQSYMVGADSSTVGNGAVEGWRWGPWGSEIKAARPITAAATALEWLRLQQSPVDGGYDTTGSTVETLFAIGANERKAADWRRGLNNPSLLHYMMGHSASFARNGAASAGKVAVGLVATDGCRPYGTKSPLDFYDPATGVFSDTYQGAGSQAWGILGVAALNQGVPNDAVSHLKSLQLGNGAWEWQTGFGDDTNITALAVQALVAAGEPVGSSTVISAMNYLKTMQGDDGGFRYDNIWSAGSDTNSTAYVVQAILAIGQDPVSSQWTINNTNPISYLLGMQLGDGSFEWQPGSGSNRLATQQAIPALLGRPQPIKVADLALCRTLFLPVIRKLSTN